MTVQEISDEQLEQASKELVATAQIIRILTRVEDPIKRARVLRAVLALHGLDES